MILVIKIVKLVIWAILHYRVMGDVYVELGVVFYVEGSVLCRVEGSVLVVWTILHRLVYFL